MLATCQFTTHPTGQVNPLPWMESRNSGTPPPPLISEPWAMIPPDRKPNQDSTYHPTCYTNAVVECFEHTLQELEIFEHLHTFTIKKHSTHKLLSAKLESRTTPKSSKTHGFLWAPDLLKASFQLSFRKILPGKPRGWKQNPRWVPSSSPSKNSSTVTVLSITLLISFLHLAATIATKHLSWGCLFSWSSKIPYLFRTYIPSQTSSPESPTFGSPCLGLGSEVLAHPLAADSCPPTLIPANPADSRTGRLGSNLRQLGVVANLRLTNSGPISEGLPTTVGKKTCEV